jgi:hypothetical protein
MTSDGLRDTSCELRVTGYGLRVAGKKGIGLKAQGIGSKIEDRLIYSDFSNSHSLAQTD